LDNYYGLVGFFEFCSIEQKTLKDWNIFYRRFIFLAFVTVTFSLFSQTENVGKKIIVIDPGHGGSDSGAIGINGIKEKDVVLGIALEMVKMNKSLSSSTLEIYLTRYSDTLISLNDRTKLAKALQADVFISLHCNHADYQNVKGTEVYVSKVDGNYIRQSILMGHGIERALVNQIGLESRGVKFANFQVLRETVDYCVALLVEFGFLSNWDEASYFSSYKNIESISKTILTAL